MLEKIKSLAARIRELREVQEFAVSDVAERLGISGEEYERFETGEVDIPASMLYEIASLLGVDMGLLLTGREPHMHTFSVTRKGKGISVERRKAYRYESLASHFIHAHSEPFLVTVEPVQNSNRPEQHSHPGQEFDYVLEGSVAFDIHDQKIVLNEGDSIYFDSMNPHAIRALDGKPARFLAVIL